MIIDLEVLVTDSLTLTLLDNGLGIKRSVLPHIRKMFYRGSNRSQGEGLGLYITQETLSKLGGNIKLSSKVGQGTTVKVTLPNLRSFLKH